MIYKFVIVSDESDNFRRDITIDADATFFDLHEAILNAVGYAKDQITSFFTCDDEWNKQTEVTLIDMEAGSDEDIYVMESSRLHELVNDKGQKLIYVFEPLTERCFFMELRDITPGHQDKAQTVKSVGEAPKQVTLMEEMNFDLNQPIPTGLDDDDFFGEFSDDDYNDEDLENLSDDIEY
jgi:hypothetical protein